MKPTKPLLILLQADGKEEEDGLEFPVNNKQSILNKSSDGNDGYQRRNIGCDGSQTSDVTRRCKLKIQQRDNGNYVARKSEANAQDYLSEARGNHEQNLSSAVANQPFILRYLSATTDNHQQNLSSAVDNQPFILGYPSTTTDNHQQNLSSAVANQPFILGFPSTTPDNCQQLWSLAIADQPLVLPPLILGTCHVLMSYYCGMPTYSMLI